jgi:fused signal recognition particle receptor
MNNSDPRWQSKLRDGLEKSSARLVGGIQSLFTKRKLDADTLQDLEDLLIGADIGLATAGKLCATLAEDRFDKTVEPAEVQAALASHISALLAPVAKPIALNSARKPNVILVCGVNGSGKTTTTAKLAKQFTDNGQKVMLVAGDTFRAAAVEQLQVWGERIQCPVVAAEQGADAAGLVFDAVTQARRDGADVLLIDTAGRLHNKSDLMAELQKIIRAIRKVDSTAPHDCILVMDATIGQNAHAQVEAFREMVEISGLVLTKLDGTARGGVVAALADKFALPLHAIGIGEQTDDLRPFEATAFARSLMGLPD